MCVIAICKTSRIPKAEFFEAFRSNKDGAGMAWRDKGKMHYIKGLMSVENAWDCYEKNIEKDNFPHIVHFRIGGPVIPDLTHPFIISEQSELELQWSGDNDLLFHNGVISNWKSLIVPTFLALGVIPDGEWSDTRLAAMQVKKLGPDILCFLDGKFAVFSKKDIQIFGDWEKESQGIVWSNRSYVVIRSNNDFYKYKKKDDYIQMMFNEAENKWENNENTKTSLDYGHYNSLTSLGNSLEFVV